MLGVSPDPAAQPVHRADRLSAALAGSLRAARFGGDSCTTLPTQAQCLLWVVFRRSARYTFRILFSRRRRAAVGNRSIPRCGLTRLSVFGQRGLPRRPTRTADCGPRRVHVHRIAATRQAHRDDTRTQVLVKVCDDWADLARSGDSR